MISRLKTPGMTIPAPTPRYRKNATVPDSTIMDTTAEENYAVVTKVVNSNNTNLTIFVNPMTCTTKRRLRMAKLLEKANSLLVPQVPDR